MEDGCTAGLAQPTGDLPEAMRASFTAVIIDAHVGVDAEVPNTSHSSPSMNT